MNNIEDETLRTLEDILNEFYSTAINARKREIENLLTQFTHQENSWSQALHFLESTQNPYVMMFCLTVVEQVINRKWSSFGVGSLKSQVRKCLWKCVIDSDRYPFYVRNKIAKLLVDIGRIDWPHFYPEFFSDIFQLIQSKHTAFVGLTILQTAIEDLNNVRDDLVATRKEELQKMLVNQVPHILNVLTTVMEMTLDKHVLCAATATPPPSPTSSQSSFNNNSVNSGGDILSNAFELSLQRGLLHSSPTMDIESLKVSAQCLNCVTQLFAWMPLHHHSQIGNSLLAAVFVFATFGSSSKNDSQLNDTSKLGILAMNCINEILSKNCISPEATDFLYQLFLNTFHLLQCLLKENSDEKGQLVGLDDEYILKFTEFLRLFVGNHFSRFECHNAFPVVEFLALLFQYTFKHSSMDMLQSCLEIWNLFLDFILLKKKQRDENTARETVQKYQTVLVSLASELTLKMQFKFNGSSLQADIDDEELEMNDPANENTFLIVGIETLAKIAEILPDETFDIIYKLFDESLNTYHGLRHCLMNDCRNMPLNVQLAHSSPELRKLVFSARDCVSILRIVGRLSFLFTHEHFQVRYLAAKSIVERLLSSVVFSNNNRLYHIEVPSILTEALVNIHSQLVGTLQAFAYWLLQLSGETTDKQNDFVTFTSSLTNNCVEIIISGDGSLYPRKVVKSATLCLLSIVNSVRPKLLIGLISIQTLFNKVFSCVKPVPNEGFFDSKARNCLSLALDPDDELLVVELVSKSLLLPWCNVNDSDQEWHTRAQHHDTFISKLLEPLHKSYSELQKSDQVLKSLLQRNLPLLTHIVNAHSDSPTRSKQLLYHSISQSLEMMRSLMPNYLKEPEIGELFLVYFLAVFDVLRSLVQLQFIEQVVGVIFNVFSQHSMANSDSIACSRLLDKFFKMLTLLVQQSASNLKSLIPGMLTLVLTQLSPFIMQTLVPDVLSCFFEFLYQFLFNNFKYFFKSNSLLYSINNTQSQPENVEHEAEFIQIMSLYGSSFCQSDLNLFKQNLLALENLNFRLKLYHKATFKKNLLRQFLCLFMQTFVLKSHNTLQDEITNVVYNMASVDFDYFYTSFIPHFLETYEGIDNHQKESLANTFIKNSARDLPSFSLNLQHFANDLRYYKICNTSWSQAQGSSMGIVNPF